MKKSDLKSGMIVTINSGDDYFVIRDGATSEGKLVDIICNGDTIIPLENYDDDLRCISACTPDGCLFGPLSDWWIDAVSTLPMPSPYVDDYRLLKTIWTRSYKE